MKTVLIKVADFKLLLEAAEVTIDNPSALIAPKESDRSYQSDSAKSVSLMLSDTKSGGTPAHGRTEITWSLIDRMFIQIPSAAVLIV